MPRILLLIVLVLVAVPAIADREGWPRSVNSDEVQDQNAVFHQAIDEAAAAGVDILYAARVIGSLQRFIEGSNSTGKSSALCLGMMVDVVKGASSQNWPPERASQLLIELQKDLETLGGRCSSFRGSALSFILDKGSRG